MKFQMMSYDCEFKEEMTVGQPRDNWIQAFNDAQEEAKAIADDFRMEEDMEIDASWSDGDVLQHFDIEVSIVLIFD